MNLFEKPAIVKPMNKMLTLLTIILLLINCPVAADFDMTPYQLAETASITISADILYPEYFCERDRVTLNNIISEFRFRLRFFLGSRPEHGWKNCFKMQNRIEHGLRRMLEAEKSLPFKRLDDNLLYNPESPLLQYLRPIPLKSSEKCSFKSLGELGHGGAVYCVYHGLNHNSDFYRHHQHEFDNARPFITAYDVVEIMIFLPALLILPITWMIMKRALEIKPPR